MRTQKRDVKGKFCAIVAGQPEFRHGEDLRCTAKKGLRQVLKREELHIQNVMNQPVVGNWLGLGIAGIAGRLTALEKKFSEEKEKTEKELDELREEVINLQIPSEGYKLIRNRFMTNFNRHYRKKFHSWDRKIVSAGNLAVHQSDVQVDATLYTSPGPGRLQREDLDAFHALYGLHPKTVSKISE